MKKYPKASLVNSISMYNKQPYVEFIQDNKTRQGGKIIV